MRNAGGFGAIGMATSGSMIYDRKVLGFLFYSALFTEMRSMDGFSLCALFRMDVSIAI